MSKTPDKAFILAAGLGSRMRPYTDHCPKPLLEIGGRSMLMRALDHLEAAGVKDVMINTHYLADKISEHLKGRASPQLHFSHEKTLLDTGGGLKKALPFFDGEPFYVLSGDGLWENAPSQPSLEQMAQLWDAEKMDILLLLQPVSSMTLTQGVGDYDLDKEGRAKRSLTREGAYMFTSMRIHHPRIFENAPTKPFSYLELMDKTQAQGRLYGAVHSGSWHHISTPKDLDTVSHAYAGQKSGGVK